MLLCSTQLFQSSTHSFEANEPTFYLIKKKKKVLRERLSLNFLLTNLQTFFSSFHPVTGRDIPFLDKAMPSIVTLESILSPLLLDASFSLLALSHSCFLLGWIYFSF